MVQPKRVTSYHNSLSLCSIKVPLLCLLLLWCFIFFQKDKLTPPGSHHPHRLCPQGPAMHSVQQLQVAMGHFLQPCPPQGPISLRLPCQFLGLKNQLCLSNSHLQNKTIPQKPQPKRDKGWERAKIHPVLPPFFLEKDKSQNWV